MKLEAAAISKMETHHISRLTRAMTSRLFPGVFQWLVLVLLLFTAYAALFTTASPDDNFALVFVWIFWGTVAPISIWLFGRYWCAVCPFHLLGGFLNKLAGKKRNVPKWVRKYGPWASVVLFIAIIWFEHAVNIFQSTTLTLLLLVPVLLGAVVGALLYRNIEFWCHSLCPLLPISRSYSMLSSVEIRTHKGGCTGCSVKGCYRGDESIGGCPVGLYVRNLDTMQDCIACGQCFRACASPGVPRARFRGMLDEFQRLRLPKAEIAFFASIWPGVLGIHYFTLIPSGDSIMQQWMQVLGVSSYVAMWTLVYLAAIVGSLAIVTGGTWLSSIIAGKSFRAQFIRYAHALIPLAVAIHTAFNMPRFFGAKGLNRAAHNLLAIFGQPLDGTVAVLGPDTIRILMFSLLATGLIGSLVAAGYLSANDGSERRGPAYIAIAAVITTLAAITGTIFQNFY